MRAINGIYAREGGALGDALTPADVIPKRKAALKTKRSKDEPTEHEPIESEFYKPVSS